jgi:vacuolar-type H+-ATPase subunit I/STV1
VSAYVSTYKTGKVIGRVLSFLGWVTTAAGAILLLYSVTQALRFASGPVDTPFGTLSAGASLYGILVSLGLVVGGLCQVAWGQAVRAVLDTADHTGEARDLLRDQAKRQAAEDEARRREAAKPVPEPETVCSQCRARFPGELKGQFCEKCGAML